MSTIPVSVNSRRLRGLVDLQVVLDLNSPNLVVSVLFPGGATLAVERDKSRKIVLPDADEIESLGITSEMRHSLFEYATRANADGRVMYAIVTALADRINSLKVLADQGEQIRSLTEKIGEPYLVMTYRGMRLRQIAYQLTALVTQLGNAYGQTRSILPETENTVAA